MKKVHFMGIAGSGMAPIAIIAKSMGFEVTGCDITDNSYYSEELRRNGIEILVCHDARHIEGKDIVAITPAVYDYNPNHPELIEAQEKGILMTWQEFAGKYLQVGKKVVAICGTHGKSSTTAMAGLLMEAVGLNPIVEAGTIIKEWGVGYRISDSDYFVCEADEFNNNFLFYRPAYLIINNIEMDHPEFFKDEMEIKQSYVKFIKNIINEKKLIVNFDNQGVCEVLEMCKEWILQNNVKIYGYCKKGSKVLPWTNAKVYYYQIDRLLLDGTDFTIDSTISCHVGVLGEHNVQNAMSVFCLSKALGITEDSYLECMKLYKGIGRRLEKKYDDGSIIIYDDYAHHPTEVASVLHTLKSVYADKRIVGIFEPHQISRLKLFVDDFAEAFKIADDIIVTKTFVGREIRKKIQPLDMSILKHKVGDKLVYIDSFDKVTDYVRASVKENTVIIVLGAGESYKLTKQLLSQFNQSI